MSNPVAAKLISELVEIYFDHGVNVRRDEVATLGLAVIHSLGHRAQDCAELARAARAAAAAEHAAVPKAVLTRVAEIAEELAGIAEARA